MILIIFFNYFWALDTATYILLYNLNDMIIQFYTWEGRKKEERKKKKKRRKPIGEKEPKLMKKEEKEKGSEKDGKANEEDAAKMPSH